MEAYSSRGPSPTGGQITPKVKLNTEKPLLRKINIFVFQSGTTGFRSRT